MIRVELYNKDDIDRRIGPATLAVDARENGRSSFAILCPTCGEVWGRVRRDGGWYALNRPCALHADKYRVGGSFFQDFEWQPGSLKTFLEQHPLLAQHEFLVHLAWFERFEPALLEAPKAQET